MSPCVSRTAAPHCAAAGPATRRSRGPPSTSSGASAGPVGAGRAARGLLGPTTEPRPGENMQQLRVWRLRRGLSQAQLAATTGLRPSTILRLEHATTQPPPPTLGRLSTALACTVDELLTAAELATVGTRPRTTRSNGAQDR